MGYIYKVTCLVTEKIYIGKTETSVQDRWKGHCRAAFLESHSDYNFPFHRTIRKYGKENFRVEEIEEVEDSEELKEREKFWINKFNSYYNGYNSTLGGDGNCRYSYDEIVDYYLKNNNSLVATCQHFKVYDQVVYSALKSRNIDYKTLKRDTSNRSVYFKKIYCVELNKTFSSMAEIDKYFGKTMHPNIRRCLNGVTKKAYNYTWKEIDNE